MEKLQKSLNVAVILAEVSHVFCCVLPTVVSLMSVLVGAGLIGTLPVSLLVLHDLLHDWELPIIVGSGVLIALGWVVMWYSRKIDCHNTGCGHEPCGPKKLRSTRLLKIATVLFVINVSVYTVFHRGMGIDVPSAEEHHEQGHHDHRGHDHH